MCFENKDMKDRKNQLRRTRLSETEWKTHRHKTKEIKKAQTLRRSYFIALSYCSSHLSPTFREFASADALIDFSRPHCIKLPLTGDASRIPFVLDMSAQVPTQFYLNLNNLSSRLFLKNEMGTEILLIFLTVHPLFLNKVENNYLSHPKPLDRCLFCFKWRQQFCIYLLL